MLPNFPSTISGSKCFFLRIKSFTFPCFSIANLNNMKTYIMANHEIKKYLHLLHINITYINQII